MPDAFTGVGQISSDTATYEALAYFALRPELAYDALADVKPTNQTHRGSSVTFFIWNDMAAQTADLSETADPDAIALGDTTVVLTPVEKGAVVKTTAKARATSLLMVSADAAELIGYNAGLSLDTLAEIPLRAGTNVRYSGAATSRVTVAATDVLAADDIRKVHSDLVDANVKRPDGGYFWAFPSSLVSYDLRRQTGAAAWRDPHTYSQPHQIWTGEIGEFEGFRFVSTSRAPLFANAGVGGTVDVYATLFGGRQGLALAHYNAEGYQRYPTIIKGPMIDALQRVQPLGWRWGGIHGRFREAALRRVESASSIGAN